MKDMVFLHRGGGASVSLIRWGLLQVRRAVILNRCSSKEAVARKRCGSSDWSDASLDGLQSQLISGSHSKVYLGCSACSVASEMDEEEDFGWRGMLKILTFFFSSPLSFSQIIIYIYKKSLLLIGNRDRCTSGRHSFIQWLEMFPSLRMGGKMSIAALSDVNCLEVMALWKICQTSWNTDLRQHNNKKLLERHPSKDKSSVRGWLSRGGWGGGVLYIEPVTSTDSYHAVWCLHRA